MKQLRFEAWKSTEGDRGIHFFLAGTNTYVFGFNPTLIDFYFVQYFFDQRDYLLPPGIEKWLKETER